MHAEWDATWYFVALVALAHIIAVAIVFMCMCKAQPKRHAGGNKQMLAAVKAIGRKED
ncbi:hypothetical protein DPX39_090049400 [Trypanosoma brucei equiperdum]|uniref:Transmembrane protein n=1 Tax=Trypanosoma brucei equiperdum TaxID=630700 RepID=A0A3L6L751_9TRYP|nr:hypothetical protein DPX39_090049400 [Trypanosoma brucei equiperdum]